jgi:hypothetical protein
MKQVPVIVIGSSSLGAGIIAGHSANTFMLERSAAIGGEYCNSYRKTNDWELEPQSSMGKTLALTMKKHCMLNGDRSDFYGFASFSYRLLQKYSSKISLLSPIENIEAIENGYKIVYYSISGRKKVICKKIIDCSIHLLSARDKFNKMTKSKRINAVLWNSNKAECNGDITERLRFDNYPGRALQEHIISLEVTAESCWNEARKLLYDKWSNEVAELGSWRIASIAKEFDFTFKQHSLKIAQNHIWLNPTRFANGLAAFDAGVSLNIDCEVK